MYYIKNESLINPDTKLSDIITKLKASCPNNVVFDEANIYNIIFNDNKNLNAEINKLTNELRVLKSDYDSLKQANTLTPDDYMFITNLPDFNTVQSGQIRPPIHMGSPESYVPNNIANNIVTENNYTPTPQKQNNLNNSNNLNNLNNSNNSIKPATKKIKPNAQPNTQPNASNENIKKQKPN